MSPGPDPGPSGRVATDRSAHPDAVERFAGILADWLASYTIAAPLAAEMADALEAGSAWVGAIAAGAVRRAGWSDSESVAWGISVSALAAAHVAAIRCLDGASEGRAPGSGASGSARALLAADGLIAAAHETLASLPPERLAAAFAALGRTYGDGGPWNLLPAEAAATGPGAAAWPRLVPLALAPAAMERPDGPWAEFAAGWQRLDPEIDAGRDLYEHPAADGSTVALLRAAAQAARPPNRTGPRARS
ncbi:MAG TPA: hypothetical protein VJP59_09325 [Gemmatimonadota bacterium]|nr:hypothetical protein [Gemmatimonadota bacterium]